MNENGRTLTFVGVALALSVVAVLARPKQEPPPVSNIKGKPLFEKFEDPNTASSLKIVKYSEELGEVATFEVAKNANGLWTIPSHGNYPADAEEQMKNAATSLVGLTVLDVASEDASDHEMYGVREPNEKLQLGDKGVGLLVAFEDSSGSSLGSLIIGKEVKGSEGQRFVRVPRQDQVFVVNIAPEKLSTKFEDWIEKDLLKINPFDVEKLRLKDHSVVTTTQGPVAQPRSEVAVSLDANGSQWKLDEMLVYRDQGKQKSELLPGEELNKEKLDALKNALSEVEIVDVFQKPKGLDASLKTTGEFQKDREAQRSLAQRGFYLSEDNEVWSANGELQVGTKDGVQYVLRFGNVSSEQVDSKEGALNRYLFVMARLDESKFPEPTLEPLPDVPAAAPASETRTGDEKPVENKPAENEAAGATTEEAKPEGSECGQEEENSAAKLDSDDQAKAANDSGKSGSAASSAASNDTQKDGDAPAAAKADENAAAPLDEAEIERKKLQAERERIEKENQRKLEKWEEDKKAAQGKVRELNARFAPWYYVISEDVYKKIHLTRSDVIREGAKSAEEGTGLDAFRKLEEEGIRKPAAAPGPGAGPGPGGFGPGGLPPGL